MTAYLFVYVDSDLHSDLTDLTGKKEKKKKAEVVLKESGEPRLGACVRPRQWEGERPLQVILRSLQRALGCGYHSQHTFVKLETYLFFQNFIKLKAL